MDNSGFEFSLGQHVIDAITGFHGAVCARTQYLTGGTSYAVQPRVLDRNGRPQEWVWLDEQRLLVGSGDAVVLTP